MSTNTACRARLPILRRTAVCKLAGRHFAEREWAMKCGTETTTVCIDPQLTVDAGRSLAIAIRQGMGIGPLPSYIAAQEIQLGNVITVLPAYTINETDLYLLYASRQYLDPKIRAWIDFTQNADSDAMQQPGCKISIAVQARRRLNSVSAFARMSTACSVTAL